MKIMKKIKSGKVVEESRYVQPNSPTTVRSQRRPGSSSPKQLERNRKNEIRKMARTVNASFSPNDCFLTFDYSNEELPRSWKENEKNRKSVIGKFERRLLKNGEQKPRWIAVASELTVDGEEDRFHIHALFSGECISFYDGAWHLFDEPLDKIWGKGHVYVERLRDQDDYTQLVAYMLNQASKDRPHAKSFSSSRNLIRPEAEIYVTATSTIRTPPGARILEQYSVPATGYAYVKYVMPDAIPDEEHDQ